jgi:moderate conductance mechanosensitive channel
VKLRHYHGTINVVPFSEFGAVQNMSRDRVTEKISMTVTFIPASRTCKIVKKIGLELAQDPELKAATIEPLNIQGFNNLGYSGRSRA